MSSFFHSYLYDPEMQKKRITEFERYFKRFQKYKIKNIVRDFKEEGYADEFSNDLEQGLFFALVWGQPIRIRLSTLVHKYTNVFLY